MNTSMKKVYIIGLIAALTTSLFSEPIIPIAYSNYIETIRYERAKETETNYFGFATFWEFTNAPVAIVHVVTYGNGTNAFFKLWSMERLPEPPEPWKCYTWFSMRIGSWVTLP
ncbi:MAG: hypothetical protein M0P12_03290 [Paludibacteraceae bacterium]|nr:hypothetical protein [Paludibacteraceae bacterium]